MTRFCFVLTALLALSACGWAADPAALPDSLALREQAQLLIASADSALVLNPNDVSALLNRGAAMMLLRRFDEAARSAGRVLEIDSTNLEANWLKAELLKLTGYEAEGLALWERALAAHPGTAFNYWNQLGYAELDSLHFAKAAEAFGNAGHFKPDEILVWFEQGNALAKAGQDSAAILAFEKALALDSTYAAARFGRACSRQHLGQTPAALEDLRILLTADPALKTSTRTSECFKALRHNAEFKKLTE